eukprot:9161573-Alexandrium_andersonii.AAC.1
MVATCRASGEPQRHRHQATVTHVTREALARLRHPMAHKPPAGRRRWIHRSSGATVAACVLPRL